MCGFGQLWNFLCRYNFNRLIFWHVRRFDFLPGGGGMPENVTILFLKIFSHCWNWLQTFLAFNHLESKRNFCDCVNANDMGGSLKFLRFYWNSAFVQQFFASFHRVMVNEKPSGKVEHKKNGQNRYHNNLVRFALKRERKFFSLKPFQNSNQRWCFVITCHHDHATCRNSGVFIKHVTML